MPVWTAKIDRGEVMSGGGDTTTTNKAEPWDAARPALHHAINQAGSLFQDGKFAPAPYSGSRVAGFGDTSRRGHEMTMDRASMGSPLVGQASGTLSNMMDGGYQSDLLDKVKDNALGSAVPAAVSMFSGSGMTNSSQAMATVGRAATEAVAPIEYGAHESAQNRAMSAAGMAPAMERAGYLPAQMMGALGAQQDGMAQAEIDADVSQYYETENRGRDNFQGYLSSLMGLGGMGGTSTSTAPGTSTGAKIAGAGLGGLGAYGALLATPAAPFAVGGGLLAGLSGLL